MTVSISVCARIQFFVTQHSPISTWNFRMITSYSVYNVSKCKVKRIIYTAHLARKQALVIGIATATAEKNCFQEL